MISVRAQLRVATSRLDVLLLRSYRLQMPLARRSFFGCRGPRIDPALPSIEADATLISDLDVLIVNIADDIHVHVCDRPVVKEASVIPSAADESFSEVTKAVVDSPVKANHRSPEPCVKQKHSAVPTPPRWRP